MATPTPGRAAHRDVQQHSWPGPSPRHATLTARLPTCAPAVRAVPHPRNHQHTTAHTLYAPTTAHLSPQAYLSMTETGVRLTAGFAGYDQFEVSPLRYVVARAFAHCLAWKQAPGHAAPCSGDRSLLPAPCHTRPQHHPRLGRILIPALKPAAKFLAGGYPDGDCRRLHGRGERQLAFQERSKWPRCTWRAWGTLQGPATLC